MLTLRRRQSEDDFAVLAGLAHERFFIAVTRTDSPELSVAFCRRRTDRVRSGFTFVPHVPQPDVLIGEWRSVSFSGHDAELVDRVGEFALRSLGAFLQHATGGFDEWIRRMCEVQI